MSPVVGTRLDGIIYFTNPLSLMLENCGRDYFLAPRFDLPFFELGGGGVWSKPSKAFSNFNGLRVMPLDSTVFKLTTNP
jgi:hypothetical protein